MQRSGAILPFCAACQFDDRNKHLLGLSRLKVGGGPGAEGFFYVGLGINAGFKEFAVFASDDAETVLGGLLGYVHWNGASLARSGSPNRSGEKELDESFLPRPSSSPGKMAATSFIWILLIFRLEVFTKRMASIYSVPLRTTRLATEGIT